MTTDELITDLFLLVKEAGDRCFDFEQIGDRENAAHHQGEKEAFQKIIRIIKGID